MALAIGLPLGACESGPEQGIIGHVQGFGGVVAADEPRAALIGRDVLSAGGTAHDAATAIGFALTVTLPSSAGLGGGGVCIVHDHDEEDEPRVAVLDFLPNAPAGPSGPGAALSPDLPDDLARALESETWGEQVAVPALVRGLYALHARGGVLRWEAAVQPAETMARSGVPASRALAAEVDALGGPPLDPSMVAVLGAGLIVEGQPIQNRYLARSLALARIKPGDLYGGVAAREMADAAATIGYGVDVDALRTWTPTMRTPVTLETGNDILAFSPVPDSAGQLAQSWRAAGGDAEDMPPPLPDLGATLGTRGATGYVVADRFGNSVACALTLNRPFGTGRLLPGFGFAPAPLPGPDSPDLAVMLRTNEPTADTRAALAAAGAEAVPLALSTGLAAIEEDTPVANALAAATAGGMGKALVNLFACLDGVERDPATCQVGVDPRGAGYGVLVGRP